MTRECNRITQKFKSVLKKTLQKALLQGKPAVGQATGHFGYLQLVHPGFKAGAMEETQLLLMTSSFHSVRKIKTKELQNTVQTFCSSQQSGFWNQRFCQKCICKALNGYLFFYIYIYICIYKNKICTEATFTNTQLYRSSVCTVQYIYTFTVTPAISSIIPSQVLWVALLTSVPFAQKPSKILLLVPKDCQEESERDDR